MTSTEDADYLRLLSIFHYIVAGVLGLVSLLPLLHLALGIAMVTGRLDNKGDPAPEIFGWIFVIFPLAFIVCGIAMAVAIAIAGRRLQRQQSYLYCLVVAGIECFFMPFGTVLGVLTILVLLRPSVKERFGIDPTAEL